MITCTMNNQHNHRHDEIVRDTVPSPLEPMESDFDIEYEYNLQLAAARAAYKNYQISPNDAPIKTPETASTKLTTSMQQNKKSPFSSTADVTVKKKVTPLKKAPAAPASSKSLSEYPSFHGDDGSCVSFPWDSPSYHQRLEEHEDRVLSDEATAASFPSFYSLSVHTPESVKVVKKQPKPTTTPLLKPAPATKSIEITIAPGITAPLRGAKETTQAVHSSFIANLACWGCQKEIYCIADCRWALCPDCRTISPMTERPGAHGLGLGLTLESLKNLREEAAARKNGLPLI